MIYGNLQKLKKSTYMGYIVLSNYLIKKHKTIGDQTPNSYIDSPSFFRYPLVLKSIAKYCNNIPCDKCIYKSDIHRKIEVFDTITMCRIRYHSVLYRFIQSRYVFK